MDISEGMLIRTALHLEEIYCRKYNRFTKRIAYKEQECLFRKGMPTKYKKTANLDLFWERRTKLHCPPETWKRHDHLLNNSSNCGSKPISSILEKKNNIQFQIFLHMAI
jgi:hypothetical protein